MSIYDNALLEEAMDAIKEEMFNDVSESLTREMNNSDVSLDSVEIN